MEVEWLPTGAKKIEYLESTGTQYIDMLYNASTTFCHVEGRFSFTSFTKSGVGQDVNFIIPFGAFNNCCPIDLYIPVTDNTSTSIGIEVGTTYSTSISGGTISLNTPFSFDLKAESNNLYGNCNGMTFNGTSYSGNLSTNSMRLFASHHISSGVYAYAKIKCYYFKCYSSAGNLVRDFNPVRVGEVGYLYDKVSKTLFGNEGSGSFTLGPDK